MNISAYLNFFISFFEIFLKKMNQCFFYMKNFIILNENFLIKNTIYYEKCNFYHFFYVFVY